MRDEALSCLREPRNSAWKNMPRDMSVCRLHMRMPENRFRGESDQWPRIRTWHLTSNISCYYMLPFLLWFLDIHWSIGYLLPTSYWRTQILPTQDSNKKIIERVQEDLLPLRFSRGRYQENAFMYMNKRYFCGTKEFKKSSKPISIVPQSSTSSLILVILRLAHFALMTIRPSKFLSPWRIDAQTAV
jgi:hypothetical protein